MINKRIDKIESQINYTDCANCTIKKSIKAGGLGLSIEQLRGDIPIPESCKPCKYYRKAIGYFRTAHENYMKEKMNDPD